MIKSIQIKNFKSVVDLSLDLGHFNVLIGENGCGKSNILEAIAFAAAAGANKLDYEFLGSRGIRVTNPDFMFSAFGNGKKDRSIKIDISADVGPFKYDLVNDSNNHRKWIDTNREFEQKKNSKFFETLFKGDESDEDSLVKLLVGHPGKITSLVSAIRDLKKEKGFTDIFSNVLPDILDKINSTPDISNYIIYSPEQSSLRKFEDTNQIYPLGIKGEGLFQYLKELALDKKNAKTLLQIKENLALLDWYEDFELPDNLMSNEYSLKIKDRYLQKTLQHFDQRSTNEGFLYLLFYATLFISKITPSFFAIDNIDTSFNPKLCMALTKNLAALAKKHKKQVIVTTHNPAILDGLNLKDDGQRLFVIRRNDEGHTKATRIEYKAERRMKLSEVWTNGFIGGLPDNF